MAAAARPFSAGSEETFFLPKARGNVARARGYSPFFCMLHDNYSTAGFPREFTIFREKVREGNFTRFAAKDCNPGKNVAARNCSKEFKTIGGVDTSRGK